MTKKINFNKESIIGCIPTRFHPKHPHDQSPCIIEKCPICDHDMWVSEKKRAYRDSRPNVSVYCLKCIAEQAHSVGIEVEMQDITKMN